MFSRFSQIPVRRSRPVRKLFYIFFVAMNLTPADATATGVSQCVGPTGVGLCSSSVSACTVSTAVTVAPGSLIDCAGRDITVTGAGSISVAGGIFSLSAGDLIIQAGGSITAVESTQLALGIEVDLSGSLVVSTGGLVARNAGGGSYIYVRASDGIQILGNGNASIDLRGTTNSADGGDLYLVSGTTIGVGGRLDASGADGGDDTNVSGGGEIVLSAEGAIEVEQEIRTFGRHRDGGNVFLDSGASIVVDHQAGTNLPKGSINIEGLNADGYGGSVLLVARDAVDLSGPIYGGGGMNSGGGYGLGAAVSIGAGCGGVTLDGALDLTGGEAGGGSLDIDSDGDVTIKGVVDAYSRKLGGPGGIVSIVSAGTVKMEKASLLNVDGHNTATQGEDGEGGLVILQACTVNLDDDAAAGARITAKGAYGGSVILDGSKTNLTASDYSIRVGDKTSINAAGTISQGSVDVSVAQRRLGSCSNNVTAGCQVSADCVYGCSQGTCLFANPETESVVSQFLPAPAIQQGNLLITCGSLCP